MPGADEVEAALDRFVPSGDVLELACGPGSWTARLLRDARTVTAVDAAPEMLALARDRVADPRVKFVCADLFTWRPDRRYDVVFFEARLAELGWDVEVSATSGPFYWGAGGKTGAPATVKVS